MRRDVRVVEVELKAAVRDFREVDRWVRSGIGRREFEVVTVGFEGRREGVELDEGSSSRRGCFSSISSGCFSFSLPFPIPFPFPFSCSPSSFDSFSLNLGIGYNRFPRNSFNLSTKPFTRSTCCSTTTLLAEKEACKSGRRKMDHIPARIAEVPSMMESREESRFRKIGSGVGRLRAGGWEGRGNGGDWFYEGIS